MWCSGYHYCTTSFNKVWTQVRRRFISCSWRVGDSQWWGSLTMVPAGNKAKRLSSVNHTTKTIHHHHHHVWYLVRYLVAHPIFRYFVTCWTSPFNHHVKKYFKCQSSFYTLLFVQCRPGSQMVSVKKHRTGK